MTKHTKHRQKPNAGVTFRAVILGLILIPVNTYFIMANHLTYWSALPSTISLIYNVIITLSVLIVINALIRRFWPDLALKQGELLTIYVMLSVSSAIAGHDMMQTIVPTVPNGFWFATPENEWQDLFWRYLPGWMTSSRLSTLQDFYRGESTLYTKEHLQDWLRPVFWWTIFLTVLIWVMICLDILVRKQWIERERLTYPIVRLPLEMTRPGGQFFRSRMMWMGFAIAGGISLINGLHVFFPVIPAIPVRNADLGRYFTSKPWNAMGWTPLYILPFALGLGFLMPSEMSLSIWFFYLFWKGQRILGSALGMRSLPGFPYDGLQGLGAYVALAFFAILGGRQHIVAIVKGIFKPQPYEEKEPLKYRWTVVGLVAGLVFLAIFSYRGGMAIWVAALYFLIYYTLSLSVGRIRAEVGPPTSDVFTVAPREFLIGALGSRRLSRGSLTMMALYRSFNRGYRAHPMPHTLEGFKVAHEANMNQRRLVYAMVLATVMGIVAAFWAYAHVFYKIGGSANPGLGSGGYAMLRNWIYQPSGTDTPKVAFMSAGFLFTGLIWWLRRRFLFWPLHPAGYAIASSGRATLSRLWFSVFVGWAVKASVSKYRGIGLYRKLLPFFLGLLLGDYIVGGTWVIIRLLFDVQVYRFYW